MKIQTRSRKLILDPSLLEINYTVKILEEKESSFLIVDQDGLHANYPKSIVKANNYEIIGNHFKLSADAYTHYFSGKRKGMENEAGLRLENEFAKVIGARNLILNKAEYFLIRTPLLTSGGAYVGGVSYCLGSLIESWKKENDLIIHTADGDRVYLIKVAGSPLSGVKEGKGWSVNQKCIVRLTHFQPHLGEWLKRFKKLSDGYELRLRANFTAINSLLTEITPEQE